MYACIAVLLCGYDVIISSLNNLNLRFIATTPVGMSSMPITTQRNLMQLRCSVYSLKRSEYCYNL